MTDQNILLQENGYPNAPADRIAQLEQRIVELSEELDAERVRLAACGVAAMANTRESMAERITRDNPYWSASYGDVCRAVDKQVAYREQLAEARKDVSRLDWLTSQKGCAVDEGTKGFWLYWYDGFVVKTYQDSEFPTARAAIDAAMKDKP